MQVCYAIEKHVVFYGSHNLNSDCDITGGVRYFAWLIPEIGITNFALCYCCYLLFCL